MLALFAATGGLLPSSTAAFTAFPAALTAPIAAPCPHGHARSVLLVPSTSSSRVGTSRVAMMAGDEERERSAQSKMEMRLDGRDESELDECSLDDPHVEDCLVRRHPSLLHADEHHRSPSIIL